MMPIFLVRNASGLEWLAAVAAARRLHDQERLLEHVRDGLSSLVESQPEQVKEELETSRALKTTIPCQIPQVRQS